MIKLMEYVRVVDDNIRRPVENLISLMYIPLRTSKEDMKYMMNAFHVTDLDGMIDAQRLQHKSNTISCFTKIRDVESIIRRGIETSGGLVLIVSGLIKLAADKDLFTYVDYAGNRWVPVKSFYAGNNIFKFINYVSNELLGTKYSDFNMNTYHDAIHNMKSYIGGLNASNKLKFYRKYYKLVNAYIANHPTDRTSGLDRSEYINEILLSHINIEAIINVNYDLNDIHEYIKDLIEDVPIYDLRDTKLLHRDMVKLKNKYEVGKIYKKK